MISKTLNAIISEHVDQIDTGNNSERNNEIAKRYFGFDGKGSSSMQSAGEPYNLTRESVRQITNKIAQKLRDSFIIPEELHKAASLIQLNTPSSAKDIEQALYKEGILSENYMIEGIINIIDIMNLKDLKIKSGNLIKHNSSRFIVGKENVNPPQEIESIAISLISHNGATSIDEISKEIKGMSKKIKTGFILSVAESIPEIQWISKEKDWFFFGERGRNRFFRRLEQIFSVYSEVHVFEIQKAIERSWKKNFDKNKTRLLEKDIMINLINSSNDFYVENSIVKSNKDFKVEEFIKDFDLIVFNKIKESPGMEIREKTLEDSVVTDPKEKWSFSVSLNYSPLIVKKEIDGKEVRGAYKLLGKIK